MSKNTNACVCGSRACNCGPTCACSNYVRRVDSDGFGYYGITYADVDFQGHRSGSAADPFQGEEGARHGIGVPSTPGEPVARTCNQSDEGALSSHRRDDLCLA